MLEVKTWHPRANGLALPMEYPSFTEETVDIKSDATQATPPQSRRIARPYAFAPLLNSGLKPLVCGYFPLWDYGVTTIDTSTLSPITPSSPGGKSLSGSGGVRSPVAGRSARLSGPFSPGPLLHWNDWRLAVVLASVRIK